MYKVCVKNICMNYHTIEYETEALKNISFNVEEGEFLSIVGPSGCGKSTLLNVLAKLMEPSSGDFSILENPNETHTCKIGYMFQKDQLFDWLSVLDNIYLGLRIQNKLNNKNKLIVDNLLKSYEIFDFKNFRPTQLSGGMRQRVALIRTLALQPEVLLLDEPFSALDYQTRLSVNNDIGKIIENEHKTAIMVTHDISEAIAMSHRVIILSKRPATIKKIINIDFGNEFDTPLKKREAPNFRNYFNLIWKELDINE